MEHRIVIFGASGQTGRLVVAQAVQRGDEVVALVRDASKQWFPDAVNVRSRHPSDRHDVEAALVGADAVVSALGPIAEETTTEISDATRAIVEAMERLGPRRIVIAANAEGLGRQRGHRGVRERRRRAPPGRGDPAGERARLDRRRGADAHRRPRDRLRGAPSSTARRPAARSPAATSRPRSSTPSGTDAWIGHMVGVSNPPVEPEFGRVASMAVPRSRRSEAGARRREAPDRDRGVAHDGDPRTGNRSPRPCGSAGTATRS